MNLNHFEALQTLQKLHYSLDKDVYESVDVSVHPPFTDIRTVQTAIDADGLEILLGAQHCHYEVSGAFTGEVSPAFLEKLNVKLVVCGHSERREIFGETDDMVNAKVKAILQHHMTPIMCCGETLTEREAGETEAKVLTQVRCWACWRDGGPSRRHGHRLRADLGDRHREDGNSRRCASGVRCDSAQRRRAIRYRSCTVGAYSIRRLGQGRHHR